MAWTDTEEYKVGQLITHVAAAEKGSLESLRANLNFLHERSNMQQYQHPGTGSDLTTTSTRLVDIDSTNFKLTIASTGGPILTWFQGAVRRSTGSEFYMYFTIIREGDPIDNAEPNYPMFANRWKNIALIKPYWNLPAGNHTFIVQWQIINGAVAAELKADAKPFFAVVESI